jgi:branched-chain amino acid transport system permease protein
MAMISDTGARAVLDTFARRHHFRWYESLPWIAAIAAYLIFPNYLALGAQILAMIIFALSVDLLLGYAGIVTLGHAAFFGAGAYTAGILAANGWGEPITGLFAAALAAGALGVVTGAIILRTTGLTLLMQTLVVAAMLQELANKAGRWTGGADGLQGMEVWPIFGRFRFDLFGNTAYLYCFVVLLMCWLVVRSIVYSPFGRSLTGIRENVLRMNAIGSPVGRRLLIAYTISAALAGISGALIAQTTGLVGLGVLSLERSGTVLIMLIIGGVGQLYGAFIGVPLYMIAQDQFSSIDPVYWYFWIGLFLVLMVMFARGGVLGIVNRIARWRRRPTGAVTNQSASTVDTQIANVSQGFRLEVFFSLFVKKNKPE